MKNDSLDFALLRSLSLIACLFFSAAALSSSPVTASTAVTVAKMQTASLDKMSNGAPFYGSQDASLPRSIYLLSFDGGPKHFPADKQGVLAILLDLFNDGPKDLTVKAYNQQLFELGAEINYAAGPSRFEIIIKTPPANQAKVFDLVKRTLKNPKREKFDFERSYAAILAGLRAKFENMRAVIYYFGPMDLMSYSPLILNGQTSPTTFAKITYKDVKDSFQKPVTFETLFVSYIGSESAATAKAAVNAAFQEELKKPYVMPAIERALPAKIEGRKYTLIDKPGATDNQVLLLFPQGVQRDSAEWLKARITMDLLGGGMHGDLARVLRVERGLTYGVQAGFSGQGFPQWNIGTFGGNEQTKGLLQGIPEVTEKFQKSRITPALLAESKARVLNDYKSVTELPKDMLLQKSWYYQNGYDPTFLDRYENELKKVTLKEIMEFKKNLQTTNAAVYLMGDQKVLLPILESLGIDRAKVRVVSISEIQ